MNKVFTMHSMEFDSWKEFLEEWEKPDPLNVLVAVSKPYEKGDPWFLTIALPRKGYCIEVSIEKAKASDVKAWADKSLKMLQSEFAAEFK